MIFITKLLKLMPPNMFNMLSYIYLTCKEEKHILFGFTSDLVYIQM